VSEDRREGIRQRSSDFYCFSEWSQHFIYAGPESNLIGKIKTKAQQDQDKATLAEVLKEMAKPRVSMSAREHRPALRDEVLVVENNVEK
jgi:hypothetical protein